MRKLLLPALLLLAGCVAEYAPPGMPEEVPAEEPEMPEKHELVIPAPYTKVFQTRGNEEILWGYDREGKLVLLNSSEKTVVLEYDGGRLVRIDDGIMPVVFTYENGRVVQAQKGITKWNFEYSSRGLLHTLENSEKLSIFHNSRGFLSSVQLPGGAMTDFAYDDENRTKEMFRNSIRTAMVYDDRGRLKLMNRDDDHLVLAYWKENLLSSLSGTMYGLKETVNYGITDITLVSNVEQAVFSSRFGDEHPARIDALNTFLFCTRFRKLPVRFDGQSWVLYREYMKGDIAGYIMKTFVCEHLP